MKKHHREELSKVLDLTKLGNRINRKHADLYSYGEDQMLKISFDIPPNDFIQLLKWAKNKKHITTIYNYGKFNDGACWYVMDKLEPIKDQEIKWHIDQEGDKLNIVFDLLKGKNKNKIDNWDLNKGKYDLNYLRKNVKEYQKLKYFFNTISKYKFKYLDMHDGNVMKDTQGNYRLIDLEGFAFESYWT